MNRKIEGDALVSLFFLGDWLVPASLQQLEDEEFEESKKEEEVEQNIKK